MPDSRLLGQTILRLRTLFQRNRVERELEEEFQFHIEQRVEKSREVCPQKKLVRYPFARWMGSNSARNNVAIRDGSTTSMSCCAISGIPAAICAEAIAKRPPIVVR